MPERRRAGRRVAGILVGAVVDHGDRVGSQVRILRRQRLGTAGSASGAAAINQDSPLSVLNEGLRSGDPHALAFIQQRATPVARCAPSAPERPRRRDLGRDPLELARRFSETFYARPRDGGQGRLPDSRQIRRRTGAGHMGRGAQAGSRFAHRQSLRCRANAAIHGLGRGQPVVGLDAGPVAHAVRGTNPGRMEGGDSHARRPVPGLRVIRKPGWRPSHAWALYPSITRRRRLCLCRRSDRRRPETNPLVVLAAQLAADR